MGEKKVDKYTYNHLHPIVRDSFANIYRGRDKQLRKEVAIKVYKTSNLDISYQFLLGQLKSEIKAMKILKKSENIVQMLDLFGDQNNSYIVLEFNDDGDLEKLIQSLQAENKTMEEKDAVKLMIDILNGYTHLIKNGIIHNFLQPSNIFIVKGSYKITNFLFAKFVNSHKKSVLSECCGCPLYMSPEKLTKKQFTSKSDIWSIALIFYQVLFGRLPWNCPNKYEQLKNIRNQPLSFIGSQISKKAQEFLRGCLQFEEKDRFSWDDVYKNPLFNGHFTGFIQEIEKNQIPYDSILEDKATELINNIRQMVFQCQLDIDEIFSKLDKTKQSALSLNEFGIFVSKVDKNLTIEEIEYIFNRFNQDGSDLIDFNNDGDGNYVFYPQKLQNNLHMPLRDREIITVQKLKVSIIKYNINLFDLFKKYAKSAFNEMDEEDLRELLKRIDSSLSEEECQSIFSYFDFNKNHSISFNKFKYALER